MMPAGHRAAIHLTITDDFPLAQAFVIIEALPVEQAPHLIASDRRLCDVAQRAPSPYTNPTRQSRTT